MATLLFYDADHTYTVDGEEVPSVSELTRFLSRELYHETPQYILDNAANRGTTVHKATEALDKFGKVEVSDEFVPYVQAYVKFTKENKPEWENIEWAVHNGTLYAGTVDRYGKLGDKQVILDIKTTGTISGMHKVLYSAQLNLYRLAVQNDKPVQGIFVLQLKKDGSYKLLELDMDDTLAIACMAMHEAISKTKKKRRKKE